MEPTLENRWHDLVASGQVLAATGDDHVVDDAPRDYDIDASAQLASLRAQER